MPNKKRAIATADGWGESPDGRALRTALCRRRGTHAENAAKDDWISRNGRQRREQKGVWYRRKADFLASKTDPDSSPMKRRESKGSHLGYYTHYVVDGGKARIILNALVTPFEVTENRRCSTYSGAPASAGRSHPKQVTGDTAYGTTENIAAVERAGIRAYVPLTGAGKARPYFSKEEFAYDPEQDLYQCPAGKVLRPKTFRSCQKPDPLQDRAWYLRLLLDETAMHRQQDGPAGPAPLRRALRGSGQELPWHLRLREGTAQEAGMGGAVVR